MTDEQQDKRQEDVLDAIRQTRTAVLEAREAEKRDQEKLDGLVAAARAFGATWEAIGQAAGMTKQAAWEKYGKEA